MSIVLDDEVDDRVRTAGSAPTKPFCGVGRRPVPQLLPAVTADPLRAHAILETHSKWANNTVLHFAFFDAGPYAVPALQANAVRQAFAEWKTIGIGLSFEEVENLAEAEVRIGYSEEDGQSASSVGRDVLQVPLTEPTTVYGWDLTSRYGHGTALHEIGHVLGMEHEHQNPFAGIKWHEEAVYAALGRPPNNWPRAQTYRNILEKLDPSQVMGSQWDPDSIMEYEFEAGLIDEPDRYRDGLFPPATLSAADKAWARKWYPGDTAAPIALQPLQSASVRLDAGRQADFIIRPPASRNYTITSHGACDALMALFEDIDGSPRYLTADDDSGQDRNARLKYKLFGGRVYHLRVRVSHPGPTGETAIIMS